MTARLFYLMGASGAGKDSLMRFARARLAPSDRIVFAHRYITRPADAGGEEHVALSEPEFAGLERHGCFSMTWRSHGRHYGIGIEVCHWLDLGLDVVVNGSRGYLNDADTRFPGLLVPVLVQASREVLRQRLVQRGREDAADMTRRLERAQRLDASVRHPALIRIDNNDQLEDSGNRLLGVMRSRRQ